MKTADKIKMLRIQKGMTQEELGKACGLQRAAINKYEKGTVVNIKRSVLQNLADALGVAPVDLLDDEEAIFVNESGEVIGASGFSRAEQTKRLLKYIDDMDATEGDFVAREVTPYQVECFVADMAKKYAPKTVHNTIGLLNSSYARAVRTGQLMSNPCQYVALPKKQKPDIKVFSEHEMLAFFTALKDERIDFKVAYELCLLCGMRRSEVLGLKESDINIPLKCVTISHTRHRVNGENIEQDTKTEQSHRTLALPDVVVEDIKVLIKEHDRPYKYTDYLIQDGFGHPLNPSVLTNHISEIEDKAGLPRINVHGLRHTFASMLNREGVDIARISRELGHSNLTTTLNVYTHIFGGATSSSRGIADALNKKVANSVATSLPLTEDDFTAVSMG